MVTDNPKCPAFCNLLNLYHDASLYGVFTSRKDEPVGIVSPEVYSRVINFVLSEADGIFRTLLGVPENCNAEKIVVKLKNSKEWLSVGPLVKSYLKSSFKLLNQVTDSMLLIFVLSRLMASVVFMHAFPSLGRRLTKVLKFHSS
jgi:nucleolar complex protein 2